VTQVVFDASAILAILKQEPGGDIAHYLERALVSTINLAEVTTKLIQLGYTDEDATRVVKELNLKGIPFTDNLVDITAQLIRHTRTLGLSLGDRACLALGITQNLPVLTADKAWAEIELPIEVKLIR
jgi:PIN domain nuclease of toxin-antitoxin system